MDFRGNSQAIPNVLNSDPQKSIRGNFFHFEVAQKSIQLTLNENLFAHSSRPVSREQCMS